jgi:hypothetical protein
VKVTLTARVPELDLEGYRTVLHEYMTQCLKEAAKKWLESTAHYIPVWSGASRSTFSPLASHVEYALDISPVVAARVHFEMDYGTAEWTIDPNEGKYIFSYVTSLAHLIINENFDATQWGFHLHVPGPYHFQARGDMAFSMYAMGVELPDISRFIHGMTV